MRKKTISTNQPGRTETCKRRTIQSKNILTTEHMPDWMQQYLSSMGVDKEFDTSTLNPTQFYAFESAEKLYHSERAGLIQVTFDPKTDMEPKAELTDYGRQKLERNESW
jgi:hypothetical protein